MPYRDRPSPLLPVLDNLRVAAPCTASWDAMLGDRQVRTCLECRQNVYDLSELTRAGAEALIREKEGRLCVRYFERADGTILFNDCAVGVRHRRHRRIAAAGLAASLAGAALAVTNLDLRPAQLPPPQLDTASCPMPGSASGEWTQQGFARPGIAPSYPAKHTMGKVFVSRDATAGGKPPAR